MNRKKAFTLIELLVVVSIIALLLSILMPSLGKAKRKAQGIICRTNLKQWGMAWMMYAQDYKGQFFRGMTSSANDTLDDWWLSKLWRYAPAEEMWFCPMAKKPNPVSGAYIGGTTEAWGPFEFSESGNRTGKMAWASYGVNLWVLNPPAGVNPYGYRAENFWRKVDAKGASRIPLMLDAAFSGAYASNISDISINRPIGKNEYNWSYSATINTFCIDRHTGTVNSVFLDFSVNPIGLKELWGQRWHRNYNTNEVPRKWPDWMANYK